MRRYVALACLSLACSDGSKTHKLQGAPQVRDAATPFGSGRGEADGGPDAAGESDATRPVADATGGPDGAAGDTDAASVTDGPGAARDAGGDASIAARDADPGQGDAGPTPDDAHVPPEDAARPPRDGTPPPPPPDMAPPPPPDAASPSPPDMAPPPPPGVTPVPCARGPGSTLFRMHWSGGSHSADIDVWEAPCEYGLDVNGCSALPICRGGIGCEVGVTDGGEALALEGGNQYLQVRFRVTGLQFRTVTVYMEARGMDGSTEFEAWSPLYGGLVFGPVAWGFEYEAGAFDWSEFLTPFDDPDLTAIRITPVNGALAIHAFEMCLE